jgi:cyclophilin family peptidyl-prolyl cis-trans isomerase
MPPKKIKKNQKKSITDDQSNTTQKTLNIGKNQKKDDSQIMTFLKSNNKKIISVLIAIIGAGLVLSAAFYGIPELYKKTQDYKTEQLETEEQNKAKKAKENRINKQKILDQKAKKIDFSKNLKKVDLNILLNGKKYLIQIDVRKDFSESHFKNFLYLVFDKVYDNEKLNYGTFDSAENVNSLLSSSLDKNKNISPLLEELKPSIWEIEPLLDPQAKNPALANQPKLKNDSYQKYDITTGSLIYNKGVLGMQRPSTGGSEKANFFIATQDVRLTAIYTVFARITESSLPVLDQLVGDIKNFQQDKKGLDLVLESAVLRK